jgi:hypothetical protein
MNQDLCTMRAQEQAGFCLETSSELQRIEGTWGPGASGRLRAVQARAGEDGDISKSNASPILKLLLFKLGDLKSHAVHSD